MSNPEDYAVGWICAIKSEYVAAQAFLDEKHEGPESVSSHDNNDYTLGRVGKHKVVIAVLPHGEYGITSAAGVAKDMLNSFPNVRIGLMVGIGGGAPSRKHDTRLGDIVVSAAGNGKGGVFQYDFGKLIQDQDFQETGFLNQPPTVLRAAVNGLMAQYEIEGHRLDDAISSILEKNPRLRKKYQRPDPGSDRLFQSTFVHPKDEAMCSTFCAHDPSNLVPRNERTEDDDNPAIHYGLIASANRLMKDALVRDKLAAEKEVLCFEMEAAGLMNHFPCLVIRGICDYSDSHKNKEWQGYAAMAAAAYAKDLLHRIPPNKVEAEKRIGEILSDVQEGVGRILKAQHNQEHESIIQWLTPIEYATQQSDFISRRQKDTGQWLLNSEKFRQWVRENNQTLFCPGIPGAGKTISTAVVINELNSIFQNDTSVGVSYVYCNFQRQHEQKAVDLLASLLKQLIQRLPSVPQSMKQLYEQHRQKRTHLSIDEVSQALQSILRDYSKTFIVVDALDECQVTDKGRKQFLTELFNLQAKTAVNLFVTSRFIPEIEKEFDGKSVKLEIRASDEDILKYLNGHIQRLPSFMSGRADLQKEIKTAIIKAADGIFLLAQLHLDSLVGKRSPKAIRSALEKLPKGSEAYDQAYRDAMEKIEGQVPGSKLLAMEVLSWITCAKRPLTKVELRHALAVEEGELELDNENLPEVEDMISVCAGLVTLDEKSNIIRLVHYTAQEFFKRTQREWFPKAEEDITTVCITYLSFDTFGSGFCKSDEEFERRIQDNPFYDYAARNWGHHLRYSNDECPRAEFLGSEAKVAASSQALMIRNEYRWNNYSQEVPKEIKGLHLASWFGLAEVAALLLKNGHGSDCKDSHGETPLWWAARNGHETVVKLLLATGNVDVDLKDQYDATPLWWAARNGHETVVKLLLDTGNVNIDLEDEDSQTPFSWAAANGHETVVKLLLATGKVDVDSKDSWGKTPLSRTAGNGHETVVKLLLATGNVDVDSKDKRGRTPLWWAARNGHETVVKLLLATGNADVDLKDQYDKQTPFSWAAANGHEAVVKLLLDTGNVDIDSKDNDGQTPFSWAAVNGHETVVKLLLATGNVDVDSKDKHSRTPLSWATVNGHEAVIKLLLDTGNVDIDSKDNNGQTPLSWAAVYGHEAVVKLLLDTGNVDIDSKDNNGQTPLSCAALFGWEVVVKLLEPKNTP